MDDTIGQHDDLHDNSFESFIDADAVADASDSTGDLGKQPQGTTPGSGPEGSSQSGPPMSMAAHHANRLEDETPFFPGGLPANGDGTASWSSGGGVGTPTSLPTSLPTTPKISGHLPNGSASAGRSPVSSWRNLHSFDYDNDLSFNCPYSSAAFGPEPAPATTDSDHPDLHSMPGLSYETMQNQRHAPPVPPHSLFPSHAFVQPLEEGVAKWTQGLPYGSDMPGMMESNMLAGHSGILPPHLGGMHRKSFDAAQMSALDSTASAPPTVGATGLPSHHSLHGRSMSLNMTGDATGHAVGVGPGMGLAVGTGACSSDDMLNAQAPPMPSAQPFTVKSEPNEAHLPLAGMVAADPSIDTAAGQGNAKKRKMDVDAVSASKSKPKNRSNENSPSKKAPRRRPTKSQPVKEESAAPEAAKPDAQAANSTDVPRPAPQAENASAVGAESAATADSAQSAETDGQTSSMDVDKPESTDGASADGSAASKRKPTQRAKRPPPSASQFTESGKPFPVVDTSATHSTLFVPPDVSGLTRREARLVKNRAAAFLSRQRKREQFEELEKQVGGMSRLVWKMWHTIAGPEAKFDRLAETALQGNIEAEGREVFDYLEQVIVAEGASIAPTEESIANAAAANGNDGTTASTPADTESNAASSSTSPSNGSASGSQKPTANALAKAPGSNSAAQAAVKDKEIAKLRAELEAAQQHAASLQSALADERTKSSPSSTSGSSSPSSTLFQPYSNAMQPGGPLAPFFPRGVEDGGKPTGADGGNDGEGIDSFLSQPEQFFREGRLERGGLSLTVAPITQAVQEDEAAAKRIEQEVTAAASTDAQPATPQDAQTSPSKGNHTTKLTTGALARMLVAAGFAFLGANNGSTTKGERLPSQGVASLGAEFAGSSMPMGNLINTASASSDLIARLAASFSRKDDEEADEVMEDNRARKDNGRASPLHLSEQDLLSLNSAGVDWSTMAELVRLLPSVSVTE